ncbi:hypothetical protein GCM10027051_16460 [Niabella terrae]
MRKPIVRIVVAEPFEWTYGNLFGEILSERNGTNLKIKLTQQINGKSFSSDILLLTPRFEKDSFKSLQQYYSITVNGSLLNEKTNEQNFIIIGNVTYD